MKPIEVFLTSATWGNVHPSFQAGLLIIDGLLYCVWRVSHWVEQVRALGIKSKNKGLVEPLKVKSR